MRVSIEHQTCRADAERHVADLIAQRDEIIRLARTRHSNEPLTAQQMDEMLASNLCDLPNCVIKYSHINACIRQAEDIARNTPTEKYTLIMVRDCYNEREQLKARCYRWSSDCKHWGKRVKTQDVDAEIAALKTIGEVIA